MPTVTGKITTPDLVGRAASVAFELVDQNNQPVRAFKTATDETIVGPQSAPLTDGTYTIVLPDNAGLNPANTYWARRIHLYGQVVTDLLLVPAGGGPYDEEDILAGPLTPLPTTQPSNEVDSAEITAPPSAFTVDTLNLDAVPGLVVTVPDLSRPVYLEAEATMSHSVANASVVLHIAPVGSTIVTHPVAQGHAICAGAGSTETASCRARLAPMSAGDYQCFVSGSGGTLTLQAQPYGPARITALAV